MTTPTNYSKRETSDFGEFVSWVNFSASVLPLKRNTDRVNITGSTKSKGCSGSEAYSFIASFENAFLGESCKTELARYNDPSVCQLEYGDDDFDESEYIQAGLTSIAKELKNVRGDLNTTIDGSTLIVDSFFKK